MGWRRRLLFTLIGLSALLAGVETLRAMNSYQFSYNFSTPTDGVASGGATNKNAGFLSGDPSTTPWVYNADVDWQRRVRSNYGLEDGPAGIDDDDGITIRSRIANGNGTVTAIYAGNGTGNASSTPFVMDMGVVGSIFRITQAWTPNPATTFQGNGSNVGNEIWQIGMVSAPTTASLNGAFLGTEGSLYIGMRETSILKNSTTNITYGAIEARSLDTTNATSPAPLATLTSNKGFTAKDDALAAGQYYYYLMDFIFENTGYLGGNATFAITASYSGYLVDGTTNNSTLLGNFSLGSANVTTTLNATVLSGMRPALGYHVVNGIDVSITGSTYDSFSTSIITELIPEPAALGLIGFGSLFLATRRRRQVTPCASRL